MARKHQNVDLNPQNAYTSTADWNNMQSRFNFNAISSMSSGVDVNASGPSVDTLQNVYSNSATRNALQRDLPNNPSRPFTNNYDEQTARLYAQAGAGELPNMPPMQIGNRMGGYPPNVQQNNDYPYQ